MKLIAGLVKVAFSAAVFLAGPARAEGDDMIAKGRALVTEKCARCHAVGPDDASPHETAPPFRDVVEIYPSEDLAEALAEGIVSGHPDMPVFTFKPEEIEAFLGYLNTLAKPR